MEYAAVRIELSNHTGEQTSSVEKFCWDVFHAEPDELERFLHAVCEERAIQEHERPHVIEDARSQVQEHRALLSWLAHNGLSNPLREVHVHACWNGWMVELRDVFDCSNTATSHLPLEEYAHRVCAELAVPALHRYGLAAELCFEIRRAAIDSVQHGGVAHAPVTSADAVLAPNSLGASLVRRPSANIFH